MRKIPINQASLVDDTKVFGIRGYGGTTTGVSKTQADKLQYDPSAQVLEFHHEKGLTLIPAVRIASMEVDMAQMAAEAEAEKPPAKK